MSEVMNTTTEKEMAKKISAENFAKGLKRISDLKAENKNEMAEEYVTGHISKKYISYAEKCDIAKRIINATCYINSEKYGMDKQIFNINSPARYMLFCLSVVDAYTDIIVDFDNAIKTFDTLAEYGCIDTLFYFIPEKEIDGISTVLDMCLSDVLENERNIVSTIDNIRLAIGMVANNFAKGFLEMIENDPNGLNDILNKVLEFNTQNQG